VKASTQILLMAIVAFSLLFILRLVRQRKLRGKYALLWVGVGLLLFAFAVWPDVIIPIADWVGVEYEPAVVFGAAIAFLFLMVVHFSFELSRSEERTRVLAEEVALLRARMDEQDPPADRTPTAPIDEAPED
jgi:hypothetical protein